MIFRVWHISLVKERERNIKRIKRLRDIEEDKFINQVLGREKNHVNLDKKVFFRIGFVLKKTISN